MAEAERSHGSKMTLYLPKFEIITYIGIYLSTLSYALYHAYLFSNRIAKSKYSADLNDGWWFLKRKRDEADYEWEIFLQDVFIYIWWFVCHVLITEIIRFLAPRRVSLVHAILGFMYMCFRFNELIVAIVALMIGTFYVAMFFRRRHIWATTVFWLAIVNLLKHPRVVKWLRAYIGHPDSFPIILLTSWMLLRLTSFALDFHDANTADNPNDGQKLREINKKFSLSNMFGYFLYIPTLVNGPPIIYERYAAMFERNKYQRVEDSIERGKQLGLTLLQLIAYGVLNVFCMHFIYTNYLIYSPELMKRVNPWALYGFGFAIGQFFCNKYVVCYGFSLALAKFERIEAPQRPKCIARIHLYSDMWRYFDQGLHDFLFRYIYKGSCSKTSSIKLKLLASIACFLFIYIWHGYYNYVLIWAILNFVSLHLENIGKQLSRTAWYQNLTKSLGRDNMFRITAIFGSQLLMMSMLSNLLFLGRTEIGQIFAWRTYVTNGLKTYATVSLCAYCFYQTGEFISRWEKQRDINAKKSPKKAN